jgi:hypothetical protein
MKRIVVVGTTGSGKTVLAQQLAQALDLLHIELDALFWEAGWKQAAPEVFRDRVRREVIGRRWVVDGNYGKAHDLVWTEADTLVWLDYPLGLVLRRLLLRTLKRLWTREDIWGTGNRERFAHHFTRNSLFLWALQTHERYRQEFPRTLSQPEYAHLVVVRMRSPRETVHWLDSMKHGHRETV